MARFRRFEVKREMQDGGKLRPDDNYKHNGGNSSLEQQQETEREANVNGKIRMYKKWKIKMYNIEYFYIP